MSDHIPDTGKMVPDAWVDAALDAYSDNEWRTSVSAMRAALAAVAPLIAAQERERCAALVDCGCAHRADVLTVRNENSGDRWRACGNSPCGALEARAIRALGDAT